MRTRSVLNLHLSNLLSSIIRNNTLGFHISKVEGDAICSINIKMVTHYEFKVDRFRKTYGKAVVEAHRL